MTDDRYYASQPFVDALKKFIFDEIEPNQPYTDTDSYEHGWYDAQVEMARRLYTWLDGTYAAEEKVSPLKIPIFRYGKYKGKAYTQADTPYLHWFCRKVRDPNQTAEENEWLQEYLQHIDPLELYDLELLGAFVENVEKVTFEYDPYYGGPAVRYQRRDEEDLIGKDLCVIIAGQVYRKKS